MKRPAAVLTAAVAACALAAGVISLALFALAAGLVFLMAAGWTGLIISARCLRVERSISASEVQEDAPIRVRFTVRGLRWLPVTLEVEDHRGGWLRVNGSDAALELRVGRPGAYSLAPSRMRLRDGTGLFERRLAVGRPEPLLILPAPVPWSRGGPIRPGLIDDLEPEGLRPYVSGTPLARVHWPSLARGEGLHVRHLAPPVDGMPLVVVDTVGAPSTAALHWAARTAAGYVLALAHNGGCRVLLPGDPGATSVFGSGDAWRTVHRRLATLGAHPSERARPPAGTAALRVSVAAAPAVLVMAPALPAGILGRDPWVEPQQCSPRPA
jgi:uncharacterized protein (DUF58 family)